MTEFNQNFSLFNANHHVFSQYKDLIHCSTLHFDSNALNPKPSFRITPTLSEASSEANLNSTHDDSVEDNYTVFPLPYNEFLSNKQWAAEVFNLDTFKVFPCQQKVKHNHKQCAHYHYPRDRRRPGHFSSNYLCKYLDNPRSCPRDDACPYDHSRVEQLYSPNKYKTKFCSFYPNQLHRCEFGIYCSFAHDEHEIKIELIHNLDQHHIDFYMFYYKTVWCPFNLVEHDRARCVYAHNWQDFRRKPADYEYEATCCQQWKVSEFLRVYEDGGCPMGYECKKCHGWKELEYHPLNYKTKKCAVKKCLGGRVCPYYHTNKEKRDVKAKDDKRLNNEKNAELFDHESTTLEPVAGNITISPSESELEVQSHDLYRAISRNVDIQTTALVLKHQASLLAASESQEQGPKHHSTEEPFQGFALQPKWTYIPEKSNTPRFLGLPSCKGINDDSDWAF